MTTKSVTGRLLQKRDTTANWNAARGFVPMLGEIIVYTDARTYEREGQLIIAPSIKVGDGNAYVQDLPFVDDYTREQILEHIMNTSLHVTDAERTFWNNKLNVQQEVVGETLVLNRN